MSERRACKSIGCSRMTIRYKSTRPDDLALRERMTELARERRRFGYRRLHVLLKREGYVVNHKKLFRLTARKNWQCAAMAGAKGRSARGRRCLLLARPHIISGVIVHDDMDIETLRNATSELAAG